VNGNSIAYNQGELSASAESSYNKEVPLYGENQDNLFAIRGSQEHRSVILVKLHYNNTGRVLDRLSPRCPADIINYTASAITEANRLPKVRRQHQIGINAYRDLLRKVTRLIVGGSSRARADILRRNLDNRPAEAVEVIVVIFVHPIFGGVYSQGVNESRDLPII
jgi:hypothetical protein